MSISVQTLSSVPLFTGLPESVLEDVLKDCTLREIPAHSDLLRASTLPNHLIVILQGQLQLSDVAEDGRVIRMSFANPGDLVGLLSVIDDQPIVSNVSTSQASKLLLLPVARAKQLVFGNPAFSEQVMKLLARHIRRATDERRLLSLPNAFQRVFAQIFSLAQQVPPASTQTAALPKQHDIAVMVNTSRETVSRALQLLVKRGILVKDGHKIVIRQPEQLRQLATEGLPSNESSSGHSHE